MTIKKTELVESAHVQIPKRGKGRPSADDNHIDGKEILIEKTCELLSKLPPKEVTRSAVARAANVDPSLIRYYFKTHSQLLVAGFERATEEYNWILAGETERYDNTPEGQLKARMSALFKLTAKYPYYHRLIVEEIAPAKTQAARGALDKLTKNRKAAYQDLLRRGKEEGVFREVDVNLTFIAIISLCHFFRSSPEIVKLVTGRSSNEDELADAYKDMVFDLILNGIRKRD